MSCGSKENNESSNLNNKLIDNSDAKSLTEYFTQAYYTKFDGPMLDFIIVVDDSKSMELKWPNIRLKIRNYYLSMKEKKIDVCIGVVRSSVVNIDVNTQVNFNYKDKMFACTSDPLFSMVLDGNLVFPFYIEGRYGNNVSFFALDQILLQKSIYQNQGFFRSGAKLATLFVSDRSEISETNTWFKEEVMSATNPSYGCQTGSFLYQSTYSNANGRSVLNEDTISTLDKLYQAYFLTPKRSYTPSGSYLICKDQFPFTVLNHQFFSTKLKPSIAYGAVLGHTLDVSILNEEKAHGYIDFVQNMSSSDFVNLSQTNTDQAFLSAFVKLNSMHVNTLHAMNVFKLDHQACSGSIKIKVKDVMLTDTQFSYDSSTQQVTIINENDAGANGETIEIQYTPKQIGVVC